LLKGRLALEKKTRQKRAIHHVDPHEIEEAIGRDNEKTRLFFAKRLNDLLKEKETAQEDLASKTGLSMSSISTYRNGKAEPKITAFNEIATALNVSTDYLLGNSKYETTNPDKKAACMYTGLSEGAIEAIRSLNKDESRQYIKIFNTFCASGFMTEMLECFNMFLLHHKYGECIFKFDDRTESIDITAEFTEWQLNKKVATVVDKITAKLYEDALDLNKEEL